MSASQPETRSKNSLKKSGSENRQRQKFFIVRLLDDEQTEWQRRTSEAGLSPADYFRQACLQAKPLRKSRRTTPDSQAVLQLLAQVNKLGGNINQIAAKLNSGGYSTAKDVRQAVADVQAMREVIVRVFERSGKDANPSSSL